MRPAVVDAAGDRRGLGPAVGAGASSAPSGAGAGRSRAARRGRLGVRRDGACHACTLPRAGAPRPTRVAGRVRDRRVTSSRDIRPEPPGHGLPHPRARRPARHHDHPRRARSPEQLPLAARGHPVHAVPARPGRRGGAVTMFFIISGLIVTSGLLREEAAGRMDPVRFLARRLVRVGAQIVPLCAALLAVSLIDPTDANSLEKTVRTVTNTPDLHQQPALPDQPVGSPGGHGPPLVPVDPDAVVPPGAAARAPAGQASAALRRTRGVHRRRVDGLPAHHGVGHHVVRALGEHLRPGRRPAPRRAAGRHPPVAAPVRPVRRGHRVPRVRRPGRPAAGEPAGQPARCSSRAGAWRSR